MICSKPATPNKQVTADQHTMTYGKEKENNFRFGNKISVALYNLLLSHIQF